MMALEGAAAKLSTFPVFWVWRSNLCLSKNPKIKPVTGINYHMAYFDKSMIVHIICQFSSFCQISYVYCRKLVVDLV